MSLRRVRAMRASASGIGSCHIGGFEHRNADGYQQETTQYSRQRSAFLSLRALSIMAVMIASSDLCQAFSSSRRQSTIARSHIGCGTALFVVEPKERTGLTNGRETALPSNPMPETSYESIFSGSSYESLLISSSASEEEGASKVECQETESSHSNGTESEGDENQEPEEDEGRGAKGTRLTKTAQAAALLGRRGGNTRKGKVATNQSTSVGIRRTGSASKARAGTRSMTRLTDAIRRGAAAAGPDSEKSRGDDFKTPNAVLATKSAIEETVQSMMKTATNSMGILGEHLHAGPLPEGAYPTIEPAPGTVLVESGQTTKPWHPADRVTIRMATMADDLDIANLRLSVFSDFSPDMRQAFCAKSCQVLSNRRNRGAACVVATVPRYGSILSQRSDIILGSAECSFHEFQGTALGRQRPPDSILYITEVAVSPSARKKGIGQKIMKSIDKLATIRDVETLYLHVDVTNTGALSLYERAGYSQVPPNDTRFEEFTRSLNLHDGATKGRNHYLLFKHLLTPTWLPEENVQVQQGTLGFEVMA